MQRIIRTIDLFSELSGRVAAWLTLFMVLITFLVVALRYVFDTGSIALQESITYMHALVFLIGAAYTLKHQGHVRVDIFYRSASPRVKAWTDLFGSVFLLMPVCIFIAWVSWGYVSASWALSEGSREAGGLPGVYLLKSSILLMVALLSLQAVAEILRCILALSSQTSTASDTNN